MSNLEFRFSESRLGYQENIADLVKEFEEKGIMVNQFFSEKRIEYPGSRFAGDPKQRVSMVPYVVDTRHYNITGVYLSLGKEDSGLIGVCMERNGSPRGFNCTIKLLKETEEAKQLADKAAEIIKEKYNESKGAFLGF